MQALRVTAVAAGVIFLLAGCGSNSPSSSSSAPSMTIGSGYNRKSFTATGTAEPIKSSTAWVCYDAPQVFTFKSFEVTIQQMGTNGAYAPWGTRRETTSKNQDGVCVPLTGLIQGGYRVSLTTGGRRLGQRDFKIQVATSGLTIGTGYNHVTYIATGTQQPLPAGTAWVCYGLSGPLATPSLTVTISQKLASGAYSTWATSTQKVSTGEEGMCVPVSGLTQGSYQISMANGKTVLASKPLVIQ